MSQITDIHDFFSAHCCHLLVGSRCFSSFRGCDFSTLRSAGVCCSSAAHHEAEVSVNHKGCEVNSLTETRSTDLFLSRTVINNVCFKSLLPDFSFTGRMLDELAAGKFFYAISPSSAVYLKATSCHFLTNTLCFIWRKILFFPPNCGGSTQIFYFNKVATPQCKNTSTS